MIRAFRPNSHNKDTMLLTPTDHSFSWKKPPRLVLGLSLVLTLIFVFWHGADVRSEARLQEQYVKELLPVEWPLYETHLLKTGRRSTLEFLKAAKARGDNATLTAYLGADDAFVHSIRVQGKDYLDGDTLDRWENSRKSFDPEHQRLSYEALGVDPEHFRPITFLTFNLVQTQLVEFLGVLLLLLTAGMALELALGSGAVLASFLGGGIVGAIVYLVGNGSGVLALAGGGAGVASVTGMFLMHFRSGKVKYAGAVELTALLIPLLWVGFLVAQFFLADLRIPVLAAQIAGFASGPLWHVVYKRWFAHESDLADALPEETAEDVDLAYREQLQLALDAVGRMEFVEAQKRLRELVRSYPQDMRVLTQLYHLEKLDPNSTTYDAVSRRLFQLSAHSEDGGHIALPVYRDYDKLSLEKKALDTETSLKLVMRFARIGEVKDAEKIMKAVLVKKVPHPLMAKAAHALSQAFEQLHDPARAAQYRDLAGR